MKFLHFWKRKRNNVPTLDDVKTSSCLKNDAQRIAKARRGERAPTQNNKEVKTEQLELSKTYLSVWNSRLLVYKVYRLTLHDAQTHAKMSPYFYISALFKSF
jgi:hypothetical protein